MASYLAPQCRQMTVPALDHSNFFTRLDALYNAKPTVQFNLHKLF